MPETLKVEKAAKPAKSNSGSLQPLLWVMFITIIMVVFPESVILLFIGLLPTIVAFMIEKSPEKYSTFCVGAMNITGVFPSMLELWAGQNNITQAIQIITNILDLVIMYAAASFGWLLYIAIPPVVRALQNVVGQKKIIELVNRQRELIGEWGEDITSQAGETATEHNGKERLSSSPQQKLGITTAASP